MAHKAYKYKFTEDNPPLMEDIKGPPLRIPPADLVKEIGAATWTDTVILADVPAVLDAHPDGFERLPIVRTTRYNMIRKKVWALVDPAPRHYARTETRKVTIVNGYSRIEKVTFARTLGLDAGKKLFGFNVKVRAELQLTEETEQTWREERTEETETTFEAKHWYASWALFDIMEGTKRVTYDWGLPPENGNAAFRVILANYDDAVADSVIRLRAPLFLNNFVKREG